MRSAIAWWSRGLGGSEADVEDRGSRMLANLLQMPTAQFHQMYFLQKPLLVRCTEKPSPAGSPSKMLTLADVKALVRRREPRPARFLRDVDVTKYVDGKRSALNGGDGEVEGEEAGGGGGRSHVEGECVEPADHVKQIAENK